MREDVRLRVMQAAEHILETGATVRACAAKYGVSKTTIHKDMRERLPRLDGALFKEVDAVLKKNLEERHIRGGAATREKFRRSRPPPPLLRYRACKIRLWICRLCIFGICSPESNPPFETHPPSIPLKYALISRVRRIYDVILPVYSQRRNTFDSVFFFF